MERSEAARREVRPGPARRGAACGAEPARRGEEEGAGAPPARRAEASAEDGKRLRDGGRLQGLRPFTGARVRRAGASEAMGSA